MNYLKIVCAFKTNYYHYYNEQETFLSCLVYTHAQRTLNTSLSWMMLRTLHRET